MRRALLWTAGAAVLLGLGGVAALAALQPEAPERDLAGLEGDVGRGTYVARLAGCIACHTDAEAGGAVLAGGAPIETDYGTFRAPNITPHPEDGIGDWTLEDFARALSEGKSPEGKHYFPSFPYPFYTRLSEQEIVDLWAAVNSVPPVEGGPGPHGLKFPFGFHQGVALWNALFFEPGPLEPVEERSEEWNRGRYLARGPAHCGACHTPRNLLGARQIDRRYQGGEGPGGSAVPDITPDALREAGWDAGALAYGLRTGIMPDGDVFGGAMVEVVRDGTQFWSDADLQAIATYLMDSEVEE